jgi:hypothetical protein
MPPEASVQAWRQWLKGEVMSIFDDREKAAERNFAREQEVAFRIIARRNKLLGLWAAGKMGLEGDAATRYALDVVDAEITEHGDAGLIKKVHGDLVARGLSVTEAEIGQHLAVFGARARAQILQGNPD